MRNDKEQSERVLREVLRKVYRAARKAEPRLPRSLPGFTVQFSTRKEYTTGRAWWFEHRIHLTVGKGCGRVFPILQHEVAHLVAHARGGYQHDDIFKAANAELAHVTGIEAL